MELDLEAGWAYELLAKFGTRDLTLEGDCPGLAFLLTHDVPLSHVAAIKSNFLGELKIARSAGFEERIRGLMSSFDIPDTVLNREKAMTQFFEARAAALLTIDERHALVDKSKSEFTREARTEAVPVASVEAAQPGPSSAAVVEQLPFTGGPVAIDGKSDRSIAYLDLNPSSTEPVSAIPATSDKKPQRMVWVADFEEECSKLIKNMGRNGSPRPQATRWLSCACSKLSSKSTAFSIRAD